MTDRILTTHTGSLPRTAKVVEQLIAEEKNPGTHRAHIMINPPKSAAGTKGTPASDEHKNHK